MPCRPRSPIAGHSSRGNQSSASILAASGAICSSAKRAAASRIIAALSLRPKSKSGVARIWKISPFFPLDGGIVYENAARPELVEGLSFTSAAADGLKKKQPFDKLRADG